MEYKLHKVSKSTSADPIIVPLTLSGQQLNMEVDTGAALSIISEVTQQSLFPKEKLHSTDIILKTYTDEPLQVKGKLHMKVQYGDQLEKLALIVVAGNGPSLLGRNWLKYIRLNWTQIFAIRTAKRQPLETLLQQHQKLFSKEAGPITPFTATLHVPTDATPRFYKPRPVPFAIKDAISRELTHLEQQGIISPVAHSKWAAPIVPVPKKDGKFRICGDYKVTVNQALAVEEYPLPAPEELFATLAGGKVFSKLDLSQAYLQLPMDESSKEFLTINTHQGLYVYNRLPFGVASAPAIFQKLMDMVLQGISGVACYIDDILISSVSEETHLKILTEVFTHLEKHGFHLKKEKCEFLQSSIEYLGHIICEEGIKPVPSKVEAILKAPTPENVQQLRSFLGLINYYGKFTHNLASLLHPLNSLLQTHSKWLWTAECEESFQKAKDQIASAKVLTHYDPTLPITLAADASAYGVGAVISHISPDGVERPIAFASRSLTTSERNYAQLEKEALSLIFGVKKFHRYLYGRKFTLVTDHKPLTTILGSKKGIPSLAAARLQRWAILLSAYTYDIRYKSTMEHANADGLSRLPLPSTPSSDADQGPNTFNIGQVQALPVTAQNIEKATRRDPILSQVYRHVQNGWPQQVSEDLQIYKDRSTELSTQGGCLMWGLRVIVPTSLQSSVLKSLHRNHPGITRMKATSRSYFWWKGLDKDIETVAKTCTSCQVNQSNPAQAPLHPWVWPDQPWKCIHVDFAGPFLGHMFMVVVDAHSKWPEVFTMTSTLSEKTIEVLRSLFSRYGLPEQIVTDNGPQFTSAEFSDFTKGNGIKHIRSAPYHPASNGQVERFVQTLKRSLKASQQDNKSLQHLLSEFLFEYRATPHSTTKESPSQLFLKRSLRTRFHLMQPDLKRDVVMKQAGHKVQHDQHSRNKEFTPGSNVLVRVYRGPNKWISGIVLQKLGPVTYSVEIEPGKIVKRHTNQLRTRDSMPNTAIDNNRTSDTEYFDYPSPNQYVLPITTSARFTAALPNSP